jgi:protocatechuate 3,4-dioxygenase beta subunit/pimeloyl-ACP methyl ester carboxylesterase
VTLLWRWLKRLVSAVLLLVLLLVAVGIGYEQWSRFRLPETHPPPGERFAVGDSSWHMNCRGSGSPTVILESGLTGFGSTHWFAVQPEVERLTRVCSYDRAGIMWSDAVGGPRTGQRMVQELHDLLAVAGVAPPYVVAGHSFGGPLARMFDQRFPGEITGFVFVDTPQPDQQSRMPPGALGGPPPPTWALAAFTGTGLVRLMPATQSPRFPASVREDAQAYAPHSAHGMYDEIRNLNATVLEAATLNGSPGALGARPVVVLTRSLFDRDPEGTRAVWMAMQREIAAFSSNTDHRVIEGTTHNIHIDVPEAVASAIRDVVEAARTGSAVNVVAQVPYFPDVYLAPKFEAPANAPSRVVVAGPDEPGERLVVSGRALDRGQPVAGVSIYVFQTDVEGRYSKVLTGNDAELDPRLYGIMRSDLNGAYEYETIRPGHYDGNAAHVHYLVRAEGYYPLLLDLWFDDDPELLSRRQEGRPEIPLSFPKNVVAIRPVTRDASGVWRTTRDIEMVRQ